MNDKPEIEVGKLPVITKFIYTLGVLPTSYLMSMTYQEQVTWLYNYLQTQVIPNINTTNGAVEELQTLYELLRTYVNDYFDNLDVQEEINNKLDEMVQDGTLKDILDELLVYEKLDKKDNQQMNNLSMKRIMRSLERNGNSPEHITGEDYASLQGGIYTGNNKMLIARIRNNSVNDTLIQEISLDTGLVIREKKLELCHANSITFNPDNNKIYVASLLLNINDENVPQKEIFVINYNDLTLDTTITLNEIDISEGVHSISYDIEKKKYYIATEDFNNSNKLSLYELNIENYSLTKIELNDESNLLNISNNNDILVYNNILYILKFTPQNIICYDLETLELRNIYNISAFNNEGLTIGEMENISIKYDSILKNLIIGSNHLECQNGFYNVFQYFETNCVYNISNNTRYNYNNLNRTLYVDINSNAINPNGRNDNPFKHLSEALEIAQNTNGGLRINIADGIYPYIDFQVSKGNITIYGNTNNPENVIINGIRLLQCNHIYLSALSIINTSEAIEGDIFIQDSYVRMSNIIFNSDKNYHINLRSSTLELGSITYSNNLVYSISESSIITHSANPNYKILNQIPQINKPIKLVNNIAISNTPISVSYSGYELLVEGDNRRMSVFAIGNGAHAKNEFMSRNNTGNRTTTLLLGDLMIQVKIDYDLVNKNLLFSILKAFKLSTSGISDVTSSTTINIALFFEKILQN